MNFIKHFKRATKKLKQLFIIKFSIAKFESTNKIHQKISNRLKKKIKKN